ncbi:hypothetical protein AAHE18_03G227000 [Arachis hypogaea]
MNMLRERRHSSVRIATLLSSNCYSDNHGVLLLLLLLLLQISSQLANCGSIVKFLPGFQGPLPFVLETGYIGVGENEDVQAFYYFVESENNPKVDPLMLWLTGGPGCSAFSGLVLKLVTHSHGPLGFQNEEYNGSLPNLVYRPYSWTKTSSIIFVDLPVNTGFTYARSESVTARSDSLLVNQTHQFLRKWLTEHPQFFSNEFFVGGDSYSGIPIPIIVDEISRENEEGVQPWINLQGNLLGNAATTRSLQTNCSEEYIKVDTRSALCSRDLKSFDEMTSGLNKAHILEPSCEFGSPKPLKASWRRSITENYPLKFVSNTRLRLSPLNCRTYGYFLSSYWANDDKGTKKKWQRCTYNIPNKEDIPSSFPYHAKLSRKGYRSLIYSGDHDMNIPSMATQMWINLRDYSFWSSKFKITYTGLLDLSPGTNVVP